MLAPEIREHVVELKKRREGLIVSLREIGFYVSGSATLRPSSRGAIDRLAAVLKAHRESLRIEGHTDNVPIHNGLSIELGTFHVACFRAHQSLRRTVQLRTPAPLRCGLRRISSRRFQRLPGRTSKEPSCGHRGIESHSTRWVFGALRRRIVLRQSLALAAMAPRSRSPSQSSTGTLVHPELRRACAPTISLPHIPAQPFPDHATLRVRTSHKTTHKIP